MKIQGYLSILKVQISQKQHRYSMIRQKIPLPFTSNRKGLATMTSEILIFNCFHATCSMMTFYNQKCQKLNSLILKFTLSKILQSNNITASVLHQL